MTRSTFLAILCCLTAAGCGDKLDDSCSGDSFGTCGPYEYTVITSVSIEPAEVMPGDPETPVEVRIEYDSCGDDAPSPARVQWKARTTRSATLDGSSGGLAVVDITTLRDDGTTFGDDEAGDGVIDATVFNPFGDLPAESEVTLIFEPRVGSCEGDGEEVVYRTGEEWEPPTGM